MNREEIIAFAREAGGLPDPMVFIGAYERFAALVAAAAKAEEREACAKVCDEYSAVGKIEEFDRGWLACAKAISNVIRARGQT